MAIKHFCDRCGDQMSYETGSGYSLTVHDKEFSPERDVSVVIGGNSVTKKWCAKCCNDVLPRSGNSKYSDNEAVQTLAEKLEEIIREIVREEMPQEG